MLYTLYIAFKNNIMYRLVFNPSINLSKGYMVFHVKSNFFSLSPTDKYLGCFQLSSISPTASMNILCIYLGA